MTRSFFKQLVVSLYCTTLAVSAAAAPMSFYSARGFVYYHIVSGEEGAVDTMTIESTPNGLIFDTYEKLIKVTFDKNQIIIEPNPYYLPRALIASAGDGFHELYLGLIDLSPSNLHYRINSQLSDPGYNEQAFLFNIDPTWGPQPRNGMWADLTSGFGRIVIDVSAVPESEIYAMLLAGLGLVGSVAARRKAINLES